jgi:hypothetical protein
LVGAEASTCPAVWEDAQLGLHDVKLAVIGIVVAVLAALIAATVLITTRDKVSEPAIALELPAQIMRSDPLRFEPGRTDD